MPSFRKLGDPFGVFGRAYGFGSGNQQPGFNWNQIATFENGFLTPNPTSWDASVGPGQTVVAGAAYLSNFGYSVQIAAGSDRYGRFDGPDSESFVIYETMFNRNNLAMAIGNSSRLITFESDPAFGPPLARCFSLQMARAAADLQFLLTTFNDAGGQTNDRWTMPSGWNHLALHFKTSDNAAANNGYVKFYLNGILQTPVRETLDNSLYRTIQIRTGAHLGVDVGTSGTLFYDNARWTNRKK